ncbi:unnamed protein product, partial [Prorocentrum cordatum]
PPRPRASPLPDAAWAARKSPHGSAGSPRAPRDRRTAERPPRSMSARLAGVALLAVAARAERQAPRAPGGCEAPRRWRPAPAPQLSLIQAGRPSLGLAQPQPSCLPPGQWPDVDGGVTCGGCTALVRTAPYGGRCDRYCESFQHVCAAAAEEAAESCGVLYEARCDAEIAGTSDMLCTCSSRRPTSAGGAAGGAAGPPAAGECWGELPGLAAEEGEDAGVAWTSSEERCRAACQAEGGCLSASFCPQWNGCHMKKRAFSGGEATVSKGQCKTLYRRSCQGAPPPSWAPTRAPTLAPTLASTPAPTQSSAPGPSPVSVGVCWRELSGLAADEGDQVGQTVYTSSVAECRAVCDGRADCRSITLCPQWGSCWMKARAFAGSEATVSKGECQTYFKAPGGGCDASAQPTTAPASAGKVRVVTYNLFWWNAFGSNRWSAGESVLRNIRDNLGSALLGVQECDDPSLVQQSTGYQPASSFAGAQGTFVDGGLFEVSRDVGATGYQDLQARGKWGPRYATWARVSHKPTGRSIWHFNTHWCVHNGNGHTCTWETRLAGARNMVNLIREKAGTRGGALRDPVVITGDFNLGVNEAGMRHLLDNGFSLAKYDRPDFVLFSTPHFRLLSSGIGDSAGSDHSPVFAELEFV